MILTRVLTTVALSDNSGDLRDGAVMEFEVADDTGAAQGFRPSAARLYISRLRSYTDTYYISVTYGDVELARTGVVGTFDTQEISLRLEYLSPQLLLESPWRIQLVNVATGGTSGNKNNYRQGCYIRLEIEYELPDPVYNDVLFYDGQRWLPCDVSFFSAQRWIPCDVLYSPDGIKFE